MRKLIAIQGDLVITKIDALPKEAKKKEGRVVAYGEMTGHKHMFAPDTDMGLYAWGDIQYVDLHEPAPLIHDEHDEIPLEMPGIYEIRRQREYQSGNMTRLVTD